MGVIKPKIFSILFMITTMVFAFMFSGKGKPISMFRGQFIILLDPFDVSIFDKSKINLRTITVQIMDNFSSFKSRLYVFP